MVNYHGNLPKPNYPPVTPPVKFHSTFPLKYFLIDFGYSVHFEPGSDGLIEPVAVSHEQFAPEISEMSGGRIDPFAADVYSTARLFYGFFEVSPPFLYICQLRLKMPECCSLSSWPVGTVARHVLFETHTSSDHSGSTPMAEYSQVSLNS
jgi:hypothetical protein